MLRQEEPVVVVVAVVGEMSRTDSNVKKQSNSLVYGGRIWVCVCGGFVVCL